MAHASALPDTRNAIPATPRTSAFDTPLGRRTVASAWTFGLSAMALVFTSLLLLTVISSMGEAAAAMQVIITGYTLPVAGLGLLALSYVFISARRSGLIETDRIQRVEAPTPAPEAKQVQPPAPRVRVSEELRVAPAVPSRVPLDDVARPGRRGEDRRTEGARPLQIAVAASSHRHRPQVTATRSFRPTPPPARRPVPVFPRASAPDPAVARRARAAELQVAVARSRGPAPRPQARPPLMPPPVRPRALVPPAIPA